MKITITTHQDKIERVELADSSEISIEWQGKPLPLAKKWLELYFAKKEPDFLPPFNLSRFTSPTAQKVNLALVEIPRGRTLSYKDFAKKVGMPGAQRAIGTMIGKNPFPLFLPCHRVIRSDGSLGGFAFGSGVKDKILKFEIG